MANEKQNIDDNVATSSTSDAGRQNDPPRYLMKGTEFSSYDSLIRTIGTIPQRQGMAMPQEIVRNVASYFTVGPVDSTKARAIGCSSTSGQYSLEHCLIDSDKSWWISAFGSFRNGKGEEYVEIEVGSNVVRVRAIGISIPPLPWGPLSVRTFRLDSIVSGEWRPVTPVLVVENRSGWQTIDLPDVIDVHTVRVVCLSNQASRFLELNRTDVMDQSFVAVGFFTIRFE